MEEKDNTLKFFHGISEKGHSRKSFEDFFNERIAYWVADGEETYCSNCGTNVTEGFDTNGYDQVVVKILPNYCPTCGRFMIFK